MALHHGVTVLELEELLLQALPYVGFPAVVRGNAAMREVIAAVAAEATTTVA
jgi:alkylhydroperoxidase/carboxymuconolactone decarboxylase family protein YurZ